MATHKNNEWKWEVIRKFARVREGKKRNFFQLWMDEFFPHFFSDFISTRFTFFSISSFAHFHFRFSSVRRCWVENSTSWAIFSLLSPMSSTMCAFFFALSILKRDWVKKRNLWWDDEMIVCCCFLFDGCVVVFDGNLFMDTHSFSLCSVIST